MAGILLIEADSGFAGTLAGALQACGHSVVLSGDCKDGLEKAREIQPSAIVLCVELPRTSGFSLLNKLKKDDGLSQIPVVMISADETRDAFEERRRLPIHADDYLIKPFDPQTLDAMLQTLMLAAAKVLASAPVVAKVAAPVVAPVAVRATAAVVAPAPAPVRAAAPPAVPPPLPRAVVLPLSPPPLPPLPAAQTRQS